MFRTLQRTLVASALISGSFAATAQSFREDFQSWDLANYKNVPADDISGTCDPVQDPSTGLNSAGNGFVPNPIPLLEKTMVYGTLSVKYTITNGGASPKCNPKSAYNTASSPGAPVADGVSRGYVSINKAAAGTPLTTVGGTFQTSILPRIDTLNLTLSATGTAKISRISTSTDGVTWSPLLPYPGAPSGNAYPSDKTGTAYSVLVNMSDIMVKIESFTDVIRIHDFAVSNAVASGISTNLAAIGTKLIVNDNNVTLTSINSGYFEIMDQAGVVVAKRNFSANTETSESIQKSGFYIVRVFSNNQMAVKKMVIQ